MKNKTILLVGILILAFALRIYQITGNPPHLNWDEVSIGYNAYSVLQTGRDEWGEFLPTIFRAYGDYKLPVYLYAAIPSIFIFGLNAFSVRLVSVLAGVVTVYFTYLLTKYLFKNERIALVASLLLAIEPWGLFLSRIALEANLALALTISGIYLLITSLNNSKNVKYKFILASILLGLSVWTYNSARIFIPLFIFSVLFIYRNELFKNIKKYLYGLVILGLFILPMFWQLANSEGSARYENVKLIDTGAVAQIIEQRQNSSYSPLLTKALYNRPVYFTKEFVSNYVSHYSLGFLYKDGGDHHQFSLPNNGLLLKFNFVFLIFGITTLAFIFMDSRLRGNDNLTTSSRLTTSFLRRQESMQRNYLILFAWFLLAPVASSLTREAPHALRNIVFLPLPMILTAVGFDFVITNFRKYKNIFFILYFSLVILTSISYLNIYFNDYKIDYSWAWQYGHSQVVDHISQNYSDYDQIIMTKKYGEPHEFLLFYGSQNNQDWAKPASYQNDPNINRFYQSNWYWVDGFDKFYFVNDWEIPQTNEEMFVLESGGEIDLSGKVLFITSPGNYPIRFVKLDTIYFLDRQPAFDIVEAEFN